MSCRFFFPKKQLSWLEGDKEAHSILIHSIISLLFNRFPVDTYFVQLAVPKELPL